jgi:hypothetical protein
MQVEEDFTTESRRGMRERKREKREAGIGCQKDNWSLGFLLKKRVAAILKWGTRHLKIAATFPLPSRLRASVVNLDFRT